MRPLVTCFGRRFISSTGAIHLKNAQSITKSVKQQLREATRSGQSDLHHALSQRVFDFQKNKGNVFVGLDVSSRCTGIAVVDTAGRGIAYHACETHRLSDVIEVGRRIRSDVEDLFSTVELEQTGGGAGTGAETYEWHAGVEACAKNFTRGRFNAKGLVKLAQINGIAQYICAEQIGTVPLVVNPSTARTFYDLRVPPPPTAKDSPEATETEKGAESTAILMEQEQEQQQQPVKERVFDFVQRRETAWVPEMTSKSRLDISDAFLIAWYTRANSVFQMLANDQLLWAQFDIGLLNVKPASAKRDAMDVLHKSLWEWLREHKHFLRL